MAELKTGVAETALATDKLAESNSTSLGFAIPLLMAVAGAPQQAYPADVVARVGESAATNSAGVVSYWISDSALTKALDDLVDSLLSQQVELDADARTALYKNRWELYD
jgi:hypothetical protein